MLAWTTSSIDHFPLLALYVLVSALMIAANEIGFRFGRYRQRSFGERDTEPQAGGITASVFALLAFMLALTFSISANRFADRKALVVTEANAIGTAYLRTELIPDAEATATRALLREYVDLRIAAVRAADVAKLMVPLARSAELHNLLWAQAAAVGTQQPDSVAAGLFITSINEVIDLHSQRLAAGLRDRIPASIWTTLCILAATAMAVLGYAAGITRFRSTVTSAALTLTFAAVVLLIVDLDRPTQGLFTVSQQAMVDLQSQIEEKGP